MTFTSLIFLGILMCPCCITVNKLEEKFSWKTIDFDYENDEARSHSVETREYIPENNVPFGVEVWREKLFVTIPRRRPGVPSTLNYVHLNFSSSASSPLLNPYPDWTSNNISSRFLVSIYRVNVDMCDRLWTIDTGSVIDFDGKGQRLQTPRIRIFDLRTNVLYHEYELKADDYMCDSSYINIFVDVNDDDGHNACNEAFAYAVDPGSNALLVYSLANNDSWRVKHPYFLPDPLRTDYAIGNLAFQWDDGLFGFALADKNKYGFRMAFFHPMSSLLEFTLSTQILQNKSLATSTTSRPKFNILGTRMPTFQAASSAFDPGTGVLLFSLINKNGIGCWNSRKFTHYSADTNDMAVADNITMVYSSDLKVDRKGNLWAISNKLPAILYDAYNSQQVNFRIFTSSVRQAIRNTKCEQKREFWSKRT